MDVKVNDRVVVNKMEDATIFTVENINKGFALLVYYDNGRKLIGGEMPIELLSKPTKKQLDYERKNYPMSVPVATS